jgi:hypothetical protein
MLTIDMYIKFKISTIRYLGNHTTNYWQSLWNRIDILGLLILFNLFVMETMLKDVL